MDFLLEAVSELVGAGIGAFLFLSGELLLCALTFGRHRARWWDALDDSQRWPSMLLGLLFWAGLATALVLALF